ncbi:hypothetical protein Pelo_16621 [Pelomyxa schiedti]|nr:hypothetical protein Pelo_16621 [Pelomyxa schiedti]
MGGWVTGGAPDVAFWCQVIEDSMTRRRGTVRSAECVWIGSNPLVLFCIHAPSDFFFSCICVATCQLLMKACHHQEGKCEDCPCPFLHFWHFVTSFWW